jgi:hypothetical protein
MLPTKDVTVLAVNTFRAKQECSNGLRVRGAMMHRLATVDAQNHRLNDCLASSGHGASIPPQARSIHESVGRIQRVVQAGLLRFWPLGVAGLRPAIDQPGIDFSVTVSVGEAPVANTVGWPRVRRFVTIDRKNMLYFPYVIR